MDVLHTQTYVLTYIQGSSDVQQLHCVLCMWHRALQVLSDSVEELSHGKWSKTVTLTYIYVVGAAVCQRLPAVSHFTNLWKQAAVC